MQDSLNGREKILIVDDIPSNIRILGQLLRARYDILVATGGKNALSIAASQNPPDLVLLDIMMPGMDGYEVCRRLKSDPRSENIPVIFITAKGEVEDETKGLETGAVDYIVKPFTPSIVMARVRTHLELKRQRDKLARMTRDLTELNHMKDNLLAVCSHDLRSPLNGILGFADLLLEKEYLEEEDREGLTHIKTSGNVLLGLINDILDLSKARAEQVDLEMEPVALSDVIKTSISSLKHMAVRKGQDLDLADNAPHAHAMGNASGLGRVFNNLLSNAIKFSPEEGQIAVEVAPANASSVAITVRDTGIGISGKDLPRIFERFYRCDRCRPTEGFGLGLSLARAIVRSHGGKVHVTSRPGLGSTFFVIIFRAMAGHKNKFQAGTFLRH